MNLNKIKRLKHVWFMICIVMLGVICIFTVYRNNERKKSEKINKNVSGFDIEYEPKDRKLNLSDFEKIELGSSYDEIQCILGEADSWIGGGILRPVYILNDGTAVVCYFSDPEREKDLKEMEWFDGEGESKVIKKMAE